MKSIAVYCGSRVGNNPVYLEACDELAKLFAEKGIVMVYGGGSVGLMGRMADQLLSLGGEVIGVIPEKINNMGVGHSGISRLHVVKNMHERKAMMEELSDAFVALPGGVGTMEELFEIFSWGQLEYHQKPYGVLNSAGYYDTLLKFLDEMIHNGFLSREHGDSLLCEAEPDALLKSLQVAKKKYYTKYG